MILLSPPIEQARRSAIFYVRMGLNPLPAHSAEKRPALRSWTQYRTEPIPDWWLKPGKWRSRNIQVITGCRWNLAVIDCDGAQGRRQWEEMVRVMGDDDPPTWVVQTPSGGLHRWYRTPPGLAQLPSAILWKGQGDHQMVELMADGKQVVAPPSSYGGKAYTFQVGPREIPTPAPLPSWIVDHLDTLRRRSVLAFAPRRPAPSVAEPRLRYDLYEVQAAIPDLLQEAEAAGLRVAGTGPGAWAVVHAIDRDDTRPSASLHKGTGYYLDHASGERLPYFALLAALDATQFPTWADAVNRLGDRYGVPQRGAAS